MRASGWGIVRVLLSVVVVASVSRAAPAEPAPVGDGVTIRFNSDGSRLASRCGKKGIRLWQASDTGLTEIPAPEGDAFFRTLGDQGPCWVEMDDEGDAHVMSWTTGRRGITLPVAALGKGSAIALSPDQRQLASGDTMESERPTGKIRLWSAENGKELRVFDLAGARPSGVEFSPDGAVLAVATMSGDEPKAAIRLWRVATGEDIGTLDPGTIVVAMAFSPDGRRLAASLFEGRVRVFDVRDASVSSVVGAEGFENQLHSLVFSPKGDVLAGVATSELAGGPSESKDQIRLLDVAQGKDLLSIDIGDMPVDFEFSPDGKRFAVGCLHGTIRMWDVATGKKLAEVAAPER